MLEAINDIKVNFTPGSLHLLNVIMSFVMFGIALELKINDFKRIISNVKPVFIGLTGQLIILPLITFLMVILLLKLGWIIPPLGLGMILIAACPGGNMSNFISMLAKGNVALSVSLTAIVTLVAVITVPFNFTFWAKLNGEMGELLKEIYLNFWEMARIVSLLVGIPMILGMLFNHYLPKLTAKIIRPIKILSLLIFVSFIIGALYANTGAFKKSILILGPLVFVHNTLLLTLGYGWARLFNLPEADRRTLAIETGIQNAGLGLVITFNFFLDSPALGGIAAITAWYGVWDLISGLLLAWIWSRR